MLKITKVEIRKGVFVDTLEYTYFAFKSPKGVFTLTGVSKDCDEFRQLGTCNFFTWKRSEIKEWIGKGVIAQVDESTYLTWFEK